jgi:hypothetical protein
MGVDNKVVLFMKRFTGEVQPVAVFEILTKWFSLRPSRPRKGSAIGAVTPEREKRQAAVNSMTP